MNFANQQSDFQRFSRLFVNHAINSRAYVLPSLMKTERRHGDKTVIESTVLLTDVVREAGHPLVGEVEEYDPLMKLIADAPSCSF